jgi:O-antigen/teichoic acid export membrane protein
LGYLDRYLLAYARGAGIVAYYAAPSELILKLHVIPTAISRSLYPKLAGTRSGGGTANDLRHAYALIVAVSLPLSALLFFLAPYLLDAWLGADYRAQSSTVLRVLAIGFLFSCLSQVPFTQLHAKGRPDLVALLHIFEVLIFLPCAYLAAWRYGPLGSAGAWAIRNFVDLAILHHIGKRAAWH